MNTVDTSKNRMKEIGYQKENNRTQVRFDISDIMSEFPGGHAELIVKRPGDSGSFPARSVAMDGTTLVWTVTAYELANGGHLRAQVVYVADEVIAKTKVYSLIINDSLVSTEEEPEDWQDWVAELITAAEAVDLAIADAKSDLSAAVEASEAAKAGAETAQELAESAKAGAETAQGLAEAAQSSAEAAQRGAESAQGLAEAAQRAAEDARDRAEFAQNAAEISASRADRIVEMKGQPDGIAELDGNGLVPVSQIPDFFNDVREYQRRSSFPQEGESGILYVDLSANLLYRWNGRTYVGVGGESGGTSDYTNLTHKPQINGVELSGNKTSENLHLASEASLYNKADKYNTVLTGSLSMGRKANTEVAAQSVAIGENAEASGHDSSAIGYNVKATNYYAHAEGANTTASGPAAHAEGNGTTSSAQESHAEGLNTVASYHAAHAEGSESYATNYAAHAEGNSTYAGGQNSHAEGQSSYAGGDDSHAEGSYTVANGYSSHAEGGDTTANGAYSHVSGVRNVPDSYDSWTEWAANTSYAVGDKVKVTTTENDETTVKGYICTTANNDAEFDSYNWQEDTQMNFAEIVGNGDVTNFTNSNARALDWKGNGYLKGDLYVGCNDNSTGGTKVAKITEVLSQDAILVQDSQPTSASNKIWLTATPPQSVQVPTVAELSALSDVVAPDYSNLTFPVSQGQRCIHEGGYYEANQAISTSEDWTSAHWTDLGSIGADLTSLKNEINVIVPAEYSSSSTYAVGDLCWHDGKMYRCNTAISTAEAWTAAHWTEIAFPRDVRVNGETVVDANGVANIPIATSSAFGAVKVGSGLYISSGKITTYQASTANIKAGTDAYNPITSKKTDSTVFYGLARAAGDSTQSSSSNSVGVYTEDALSKISDMINAPVSVTGSTPSIAAKSGITYKCGECSTLSVTLPASGDVEIIFESGSTATVLTITPPTGVSAMKWAGSFDPTSLDTNTIYDMIITDGEFGMVASWA